MSLKSLFVKQVLSGDSLILRERAKSGPPPERVVAINNISCPRLARRPNSNNESSEGSVDEPFAWDAREFTRKLVIGQEVLYQVENKSPGGREYATIYIANEKGEKENLAEIIVAAGYAEVRRQNNATTTSNEQYQKLIALEEGAKLEQKGKWATGMALSSVRNIIWNVDNVVKYVEANQNKTIPAVVEHVRDGCTIRVFLLPNSNDGDNYFRHVTVMLSGVKTPTFKFGENNEQVPESFAEEAKFFMESRLLQRNVEIRMETTNNQNIVGTVIHPKGNIAEVLLREGFGRVLDWSMGVLEPGVAATYRAAEKVAKERRLRLWKDYEPPKTVVMNGKSANSEFVPNKTFNGKVIEVGNGDNISIKCPDNKIRKFFLSSIRSPKVPQSDVSNNTPGNKRFKPLYDVPYLFEAREFLRKKLIGKKVNVRIDYLQPKVDNMEERIMATISLGDVNISEALIVKGLATVVRYKASDDNRSLHYDALLAAESTAQKKAVGLFSKKEVPTHKVSDLTGDISKSKQFFGSLKRQGKLSGVVEYVAGGSRLRVYVPKETCILTILCAGVDCPRPDRRLPNDREEAADLYGTEALDFTRELCCQREVEIQVENMDKGGNFIGWVFVDPLESGCNSNLSLALVENGLAKVHYTAEKSQYFKTLCDLENKAKSNKLNIWSVENQLTYTEETMKELSLAQTKVDSDKARVENYINVLVTQVSGPLSFYAQLVDNESTIVNITEELHQHFSSHVHVPGNYTPRKGDLCAAKFTLDGCWYRAKVLSIDNNARKTRLLYVDFGNEESNDFASLSNLPAGLTKLPFQANEYTLSCVCVTDEYRELAQHSLETDLLDKQVKINMEYEIGEPKIKAVSVKVKQSDNDKEIWLDQAEILLREGIIYVDEKRREKRLQELIKRYNSAQEEARVSRLNVWCYGDFRED